MPRFVILEHDFPEIHFDLMLEDGDSLRTWRLPAMPEIGKFLFAPELPPHRREYLAYEGPVGGDRGSVIRRASGQYTLENWPDGSLLIELTDCPAPLCLHAKPGGDVWRFFCLRYIEEFSLSHTDE